MTTFARTLVATAIAVSLASCGSDESIGIRVISTAAPKTVTTDSVVAKPVGVALGDRFTDPQGTYTMTIGSDWTASSLSPVKEVEVWFIAPPDGGFAANVNVLTQISPGADLDQYMDVNVRAIGAMGGLNVLHHDTVDGASGARLGRIEYSGVVPGQPSDRPLHFLAVFDVRNGEVVLATLTAPEASFEQQRQTAEPYLLTLQAT